MVGFSPCDETRDWKFWAGPVEKLGAHLIVLTPSYVTRKLQQFFVKKKIKVLSIQIPTNG